jgi:DNA-binding LacI/PurR family transcriptional regulator/DNA-binding transcriptional regulator YhcF (GntR family)
LSNEFGTRKQQQVAQAIMDLACGDAFAPHGCLPAERELCEHIQVSRPTLRTVLQMMERRGLIRSDHGRGRVWIGGKNQSRKPRGSHLFEKVIGVIGTANLGIHENRMDVRVPDVPMTHCMAAVTGRVIQGIQQAGLSSLVLGVEGLEATDVRSLINQPPRGLLILGDAARHVSVMKIIAAMVKANLPVVVFEEWEGVDGVDGVGSDQAAGAAMLTRYLLEQRGRRRIQRVWWSPELEHGHIPQWLCRRDAGYEQASLEAGLEPLPAIIRRGPMIPARDMATWQERIEQVAGMLLPLFNRSDPPDAIMALTDGHAAEVAEACRLLGRRIGEDVDIVGYDGFWNELPRVDGIPALYPPQATIDKRNTVIGQVLVDTLLGRLGGTLSEEPQYHFVKPQLVIPSDGS